jgi:hypothetical protein
LPLRFTESQILAELKAGEAEMLVTEIVRKLGISRHTYSMGKSECAGATMNEERRLRGLELENARLKWMCADATSSICSSQRATTPWAAEQVQ